MNNVITSGLPISNALQDHNLNNIKPDQGQEHKMNLELDISDEELDLNGGIEDDDSEEPDQGQLQAIP